MELNVTSLEDLKQIKEGVKVPLEGFYDNKPFVVKLKRSSLLTLATTGQIPNQLLSAAYKIFFSKSTTNDKDMNLKTVADIYKCVARASLIEPTYEQLEEAGIELTDTQLIEIWQFNQFGVAALEKFRKQYTDIENTETK